VLYKFICSLYFYITFQWLEAPKKTRNFDSIEWTNIGVDIRQYYRSVVSSTEAWLFVEDDGDCVESPATLSHCMAVTVRGFDLTVPPASVVVATTPGCHSRRDAVGGPPLSANTYVCSLAAASALTSSTMTLSRLEEPLPRDRRWPDWAAVVGAGETSFGEHELLVGSSYGGRRSRSSTFSGRKPLGEPPFFCVTDDVGGLDDEDSVLFNFVKVFDESRVDCLCLLHDAGGLERSSSGWSTAWRTRSSVRTSLDNTLTSRVSSSTRKSSFRTDSRVSVTSRCKLSTVDTVLSVAEAAAAVDDAAVVVVVVVVVVSPTVKHFKQQFTFTALQRNLATRKLSVRLSVCQMRGLWQNKRKLCQVFYTIWKAIYPSLLRRRMVGGGDPFHLIFWVKLTPLGQPTSTTL